MSTLRLGSHLQQFQNQTANNSQYVINIIQTNLLKYHHKFEHTNTPSQPIPEFASHRLYRLQLPFSGVAVQYMKSRFSHVLSEPALFDQQNRLNRMDTLAALTRMCVCVQEGGGGLTQVT